MSIIYWIDENFPLESHMTKIFVEQVKQRILIELQFFLGELLAKYEKLRQAYTILPQGKGDIDIVLLKPNKNIPVKSLRSKNR